MAKKITPQEIADVLLRARERMNSRGKHWIKEAVERKLDNGEYGYCSLGAIRKEAGRSTRLYKAAHQALARSLGDESGTPMTIASFNDDPGTKWGDVSKAFRKAARQVLREAK
jgi:hypothetical protein